MTDVRGALALGQDGRAQWLRRCRYRQPNAQIKVGDKVLCTASQRRDQRHGRREQLHVPETGILGGDSAHQLRRCGRST
jgi:hypothetical protein